MTERMLSQVLAAEMGYLRRVHGVKLRNKVGSCVVTLYYTTSTKLYSEKRTAMNRATVKTE